MLANKLRLIGSLAVLLTLALAASCTGFFVNPTLTSVSVGPQNLSLTINQTFQMTATGTYSDGSQKTLNSGVTWSSSDSSTVSVGQTSGQVTGLKTGSATISASSGGCSSCSGTTTVTVALQGVTSITIQPGSQSVTVGGSAVFFHALANGSIDITDPTGGTTWTVKDSTGMDQTSNFTLNFVAGTGTGTGESFSPNSGVTAGTYTVTATYTSGTLTVTSNPPAQLNVN
jgi:trimeric autotransporter adhesin